MWTLGSGSVIRILGAQARKGEEVKREEDIVFLVRVPNRHGRHAEAYKDNLVKYLLQRTEMDVNKTIVPGPGGRVDLFRDSPQKPTVRAPVIAMRQLSPSSMLGSCGMRTWKGSDKYNFVDKIGQGAFATVYLITDKMNGCPYAAKELEKRRFMKNGVLDQKVENEMKIMQRVSHPNIVQFKEHLDPDDKHLYIIMEFVGEGDLGKYIGANGPFSEPDTKTIARQLVDALGYLHDMNITHRDVKPDNILIQSRFPLVVKLTDFGLSKMIDHDATFLNTFCGTLLYCAPEVYAEFEQYDEFGRRNVPRSYPRQPRRSPRYDHNVDIWSLGGVLYFALTTQPPFPARNGIGHTEFLHQVMTTVPNFDPLIKADPPVSTECQDFLRQMLRQIPKSRATAKVLLDHEWIRISQDPQNVTPSCPQNGGVDELLEAGASQLSLTDRPAATPRGDAQGDVNVASEDNLLQQELIDDEEHVSDFEQDKENYPYRPATQNERLYGEVGQSALGSQGDVASGRLNLPATPISVETPKLFRSKDEIPDSQDNSEDEEDTPRQSNPHTQRSQPPPAPIENEDELLAQVPYPKVAPPTPEPKSVYWDSKNLSTCHLNYPEMTEAQWNAFRSAAENRQKRDGSNEKWGPGKSPLWALAEKYFPPMSKIETDQPLLWALVKERGVVTETSQRKSMAISEGGYLRSSDESTLSGISISLSKSIVTWGRSPENTERYPDEHEHATRIPECALKIMVWREKNFDPSKRLVPWTQYYGDNEDLYFYVATKATDGIYVNGKHLASNEPSDRKSNCKNWMRLYNGDRIIVWNDPKDDGALSKIEVVFECNWGGSRFSRESSHHKTPELVSEEVAKKLDEVCVDAERKAKKYHRLLKMYPLDTADSEERKARIDWEEKLSRNFQRQVEEAKKALPLVAKGTNSRYSGSYSSSNSSWGDLVK
ncbi:Protein kinase protein rad53 [Neurospora sp. IMI 360204]|nr:Protein kinase protein rad53 [Neurospora sp. IMI 360204]